MSACASRRRISSSSRRTACSRPRARSKRAAAAQCTLHTHASTSSALDACGHPMCSRIQYCTHVVVHKHSKNKFTYYLYEICVSKGGAQSPHVLASDVLGLRGRDRAVDGFTSHEEEHSGALIQRVMDSKECCTTAGALGHTYDKLGESRQAGWQLLGGLLEDQQRRAPQTQPAPAVRQSRRKVALL